MVDIHSHVLFGLDDGAKTLEDAVAMVRMAAEHGTTDLVATPHADLQYKFDPVENAKRIEQLKEASGGTLRLYTGCDFHLSFDNIQDAIANPTKYTLDQGHYLLVEFSDMLIFNNTSEIFDRLLDAGMIPVITHPERNGLLRQRVENIAEWVSQGVRVQVTGQSLTGRFGKRAAEFSRALLDRSLVHVIASDAHDLERRPPVLDAAHTWLKENYSEALAEMLCVTNPRAALESKPMQLPEGESAKGRKWYQFWG